MKNYREKSSKKCNANVTRLPYSTVPINNNNAREEIEINVAESEEAVSRITQTVNDSGETVSKTKQNHPKDIGTRAVVWAEQKWGRMISPGKCV